MEVLNELAKNEIRILRLSFWILEFWKIISKYSVFTGKKQITMCYWSSVTKALEWMESLQNQQAVCSSWLDGFMNGL